MNPAKVTNVVAQTEDVETTTIGALDTPPKHAQGVMCGTRLRYGLLLGIALLSAWLAITLLNSITEVSAEFDKIQANNALPFK